MLYSISLKAQLNSKDSTCINEDYCSCSDYEIPAGIMISHTHLKGEWMVSYRWMRMNMAGVIQGTQDLSQTNVLTNYQTSPDFMWMNMHMLMLMYGITDKLTLMAMLNYNSNYMEMTMLSGSRFHQHGMSSTGLGDTRIYALWAPLKQAEKQFLLGLGINIPSGRITIKGPKEGVMYRGQRYPYAMQLGSGTLDFLPSVSYLQNNNKITWSLQLGSVLRPYRNNNNYKLGNEINFNAWTSLKWLKILSSSLRAEILYSDKIYGEDLSLNKYEEISANSSNYGGTRLFIYLGSSLTGNKGFLKKNRFSFEYGLPIYQNLKGLQMPITNLFTASWALTF